MSVNPFATMMQSDREDASLRPRGALSYVTGSGADPLAFMTIPQLLDQACERNGTGDAAVFVAQGQSLSWYALRDQADDLAAGLLSLGIRRGNRVAIWSPNRLEWLLAQFGTARIGAVLVNINPAYRTHELRYALNKVRARVLIMARTLKTSDYLRLVGELVPEIHRANPGGHDRELMASGLPALRHIVVLGEGTRPPGTMAFSDLMRLGGPAHRSRLPGVSARLDPDDPINIQFTSGTTGRPKGATLSHFNIVNNARYSAQALKLTAADRLCIPVPLYHCFGMVLGVLTCASVGAAMVFPGESFDPGDTLRAVSQERCTALHGVPTMFISMLEHADFDRFDLSGLRTGIMAGAPCPSEIMRRVIEQMNMAQITIVYGMTETSPSSFQTGISDPIDRRVSTVGRAHPHVEAKIIDGQGRIVPVGTRGELCTRGYLVMRGYWEEPEQTAQVIDPAGWMHTGDLAVIDDEGYCRIVGRVKDMLIRGGENIYPREIEEFLLTHPAIQDVQVFGIPHPRLGAEVCAWIVLRPGTQLTAADLTAFCKGAIAHYKAPSQIRFVREFPMTVTGKPRKFDMRRQMIQELGLTEVPGA